MDTLTKSFASGLTGAVALTLLHETARRFFPDAPRADILGMRALSKGFEAAGETPPADADLHSLALAGDIFSNSLYYSLIGIDGGKHPLALGTALGTLAGIGAVALPGPMGLGTAPTNRTTGTKAMTLGWYLVGGLAAAATYKLLDILQD